MSVVKISVIIPIYNHEEYVVECLKSIVEQNDSNYEIIGIDDGSTDRSYEYAYEYLRFNMCNDNWSLDKRENKGINKTINEAIRKSTGDVIYLIASDDRMPDGSLAYIRYIYNNKPYSRESLCFYDVSLINWLGKPVKDSASEMIKGGVDILSKSKIYLGTQIILRWGSPFQHQYYSREFYNKYGPYPEDLPYEDLYFALKAISVDKFIFLPKVLKEYRIRKDNALTPGLTKEDLRKENMFKIMGLRKGIKIYYKILYGVAFRYYKGDRYYNGIARYITYFVYKYSVIMSVVSRER